MKKVFKLGATVFIAIGVATCIALGVQYQIRLRLIIGDPLLVELSKGAWVECLSEPSLAGHIKNVQVNGVVLIDSTGTFTKANLPTNAIAGSFLCSNLGIVVLDVENREFFVPFSSLAGLQNHNGLFWSNPFRT